MHSIFIRLGRWTEREKKSLKKLMKESWREAFLPSAVKITETLNDVFQRHARIVRRFCWLNNTELLVGVIQRMLAFREWSSLLCNQIIPQIKQVMICYDVVHFSFAMLKYWLIIQANNNLSSSCAFIYFFKYIFPFLNYLKYPYKIIKLNELFFLVCFFFLLIYHQHHVSSAQV